MQGERHGVATQSNPAPNPISAQTWFRLLQLSASTATLKHYRARVGFTNADFDCIVP